MPGSVDRPPDVVRDLRAMKSDIAEVRNASPRLPVIVVVESATQAIASGSAVDVTFAAATVDTASAWDAGSPALLTVPRSGVYMVSAYVEFDNDTTGEREVRVSTSGSGIVLAATSQAVVLQWRAAPSAPVIIAEGQTVTLSVRQNTGSSLDLNVGRLGLTWLGGAPA